MTANTLETDNQAVKPLEMGSGEKKLPKMTEQSEEENRKDSIGISLEGKVMDKQMGKERKQTFKERKKTGLIEEEDYGVMGYLEQSTGNYQNLANRMMNPRKSIVTKSVILTPRSIVRTGT